LIWLVVVAIGLAKPPVELPEYTEDIEVFKKDKNMVRMQMLAGCWLIVDEHLSTAKLFEDELEKAIANDNNFSTPTNPEPVQ
jgi:hypothetical protein